MRKPPWWSEKKRLARRIYAGYVFRELSFWVPVGLLCWGFMVFLVRLLSIGQVDLLWSGSVFLLASIGVGVCRGCRQASDVNFTAVLDHVTQSDNLLVSLEETGVERNEWTSEVEHRLDDEVPMPGFRLQSLFLPILPALAFLLLVWFVPLSGLSDQTGNASSSYLQERVEELREKLNTVQDENLVTDEKANRIEQKLDKLKQDLAEENPSGDNPWSVMDRVDRQLEKEMTEGSETLNRARTLSRNLSEQMKNDASGDASGGASSDASKSESGKGNGSKNANNETAKQDRMEQQKEELSRALARLSRKKMISDSSSKDSDPKANQSPYQNRQGNTAKNSTSSKASNNSEKRNWKQLASRRKALKKIRRKLAKKHRRMHKKGVCRGGRCSLGGEKGGSSITRSGGKGKRSNGQKTRKGSSSRSSGSPTGKAGPDSGSASLTDGQTAGANNAGFSTKKVDAPIVNPEATQKLAERVKDGVNQKTGKASASSGQGATVENPLQSRRSSVPPPYRDSVRSYFSPETQETD